jgi:hypothetical protein
MMRVQISPTAPNLFGSLCAEVAVTGKHASLKNSCPHGRAGSNPVFRTKHFQPEWLELAYTAVLKAADFGHKGSNPFSGTSAFGDEREMESGLIFKQLICGVVCKME